MRTFEPLRLAYAKRRDAMMAAVPAPPPPIGPKAPLVGPGRRHVHLAAPARPARTQATLLPAALARDVAFVPGAPFFAGRPDTATMRLSFTTHTPDEIRVGLGRLRRALTAR